MRRLLVAVGILLVLLVLLDRVGVLFADQAVAKQIRTELALRQNPSVTIHGFPFLNQAVAGQYSDVQVRIPSVDSGPLHNLRVDARLKGLRAPLDRVVSGNLSSIPVRDITGTVSVRYADLAAASGVPGLRIGAAGGGLRVSGQVQLPTGPVEASAVAAVSVLGNDLVVTATQAEVDGVELPPAVLATAARLLSFRVSARSLPLALQITGVQIGTDALTVAAKAHDVVLRRGEIPVT